MTSPLRKPTAPPSPMTDSVYVHEAPANAKVAARLLGGLMDEAREISAVRRQMVPEPPTPRGLDWIAPSNVSGVHLYEEDGAWYADLTLDGVGEGRPSCIGARGALPSRQAACVLALSLLCDIVLAHSRRARLPTAAWPLQPRPNAFAYDGVVLNLPKDTVEALVACGADAMDEAYARKRLTEIRADLLDGGKLSITRLRAMDESERRAFFTVCALAALKGIQDWR